MDPVRPFAYTLDVVTVTASLRHAAAGLAIAAALPAVAFKFSVFAVLVFAVLVTHEDTEGALRIAVLLVAGVLVAWLPDPVVRSRLSRRTADLPGSLYFVGFTGGLLTLGPVGVIAGPLAVALLVEAVSLLADAENGTA